MEQHKVYDQTSEEEQLGVVVEEIDEQEGSYHDDEDCSGASSSPSGRDQRRTRRRVIKEKVQEDSPWRKRKRKAVAFHFSAEQEEHLVEWFRTNPRYYNKKCREYRKNTVKEKMIENKAREFIDVDGVECTPAQLKMWWTNMRTYYGKLSKGWPNPTAREQWIVDSFGFLWDHIIRIRSRRGCKLRNVLPEDHGTEPEEDVAWEVLSIHDMNENVANEDHEIDSSPEHAPSASAVKREECKDSCGVPVAKQEKELDKFDIETIEKICLNVLRTAAPAPGLSTSATEELENFARDVVSSMRRVPEEWWNDVKVEMMMVIRNYSRMAPNQSTTTSMGCPTVLPVPVPSINSSLSPINPSNVASPRLSNLRHGDTLPQGPIPVRAINSLLAPAISATGATAPIRRVDCRSGNDADGSTCHNHHSQ